MSNFGKTPKGFHCVTPHLVIKGAAEAIEWYKKAFGAEEACRMPGPDGKVMHAELRFGDSPVMIADEFPAWGVFGPGETSPVTIHLYVNDCDAAITRATDAGATVLMPAGDQFWGDRYGKIKDPFGHCWSIATQIKEMTPDEMMKAMAAAFC